MDKILDVEAMRSVLKGMPRPDVLKAAKALRIPPSTLEKFRNGHITEPRLAKLKALSDHLRRQVKRAAKEAA